MKKEEQLQSILNCLNTAFEADPAAIHTLVVNRVPCNQQLVDHPHVQVRDNKVCSGFNVGCLGVINGILEAAGIPRIAAQWSEDENGNSKKFIGFCEYKAPTIE